MKSFVKQWPVLLLLLPVFLMATPVRFLSWEKAVNDLYYQHENEFHRLEIRPFYPGDYHSVALQEGRLFLYEKRVNGDSGEEEMVPVVSAGIQPDWESALVVVYPLPSGPNRYMLKAFDDGWDSFPLQSIRVLNLSFTDAVVEIKEERLKCPAYSQVIRKVEPAGRPRASVKIAAENTEQEWELIKTGHISILPKWRVTGFVFHTQDGFERLTTADSDGSPPVTSKEIKHIFLEHRDTYSSDPYQSLAP